MKYCKKNYKIKNTKKWKTLKVGEITVYIDKPISRDYSKFSWLNYVLNCAVGKYQGIVKDLNIRNPEEKSGWPALQLQVPGRGRRCQETRHLLVWCRL